jgi:hypothetical protein
MFCLRLRKFAVPVRGKKVEVVPAHVLTIYGGVKGIAPLARQTIPIPRLALTLSLLMSYIYGAPSKARNLTSYIYIYRPYNIYIYMDEIFYRGFCFLNRAFR